MNYLTYNKQFVWVYNQSWGNTMEYCFIFCVDRKYLNLYNSVHDE